MISESKCRIMITIDKIDKQKLEKLSSADGRSLSNYICKLIKDHLQHLEGNSK